MRRRMQIVLGCLSGLAACRSAAPQAPPPAPVAAAVALPPTSSSALPSAGAMPPPTSITASSPMHPFEEDVEFLSKHGAAVKVLQGEGGGRIAISGKYQARVMTSAFEANGSSLGFVNRSFIEAGQTGTAFDNYGGEDRFWLGPEGGQYALYFAPGKPFEFGNWQTPAGFQEGEWQERVSGPSRVVFERAFSVVNYAGTELDVAVRREIAVLGSDRVAQALGVALPAGVKFVGFETKNTITNRGTRAWTEDKGLPSIWILGMFSPAPDTRIIAPFESSGKQSTGEVVSDRYFGKVPAERLLVDRDAGYVLFKADGQARGKIGLSPARAKPVLGSYSPQAQLLTIVRFSKPAGASRYVNNLWEVSKEPYGGDVSNAYNDGPVAPGAPSLGGFYELESSSPAAALAPGASLTHVHETYHFSGPETALDAVSARVLGVSLAAVGRAKL